MSHFIAGFDRQQTMLLAEHLDDYVDENSPVRAIDAFANMLHLVSICSPLRRVGRVIIPG